MTIKCMSQCCMTDVWLMNAFWMIFFSHQRWLSNDDSDWRYISTAFFGRLTWMPLSTLRSRTKIKSIKSKKLSARRSSKQRILAKEWVLEEAILQTLCEKISCALSRDVYLWSVFLKAGGRQASTKIEKECERLRTTVLSILQKKYRIGHKISVFMWQNTHLDFILLYGIVKASSVPAIAHNHVEFDYRIRD